MSTLIGPRIGVALGGGSARGLAHIPYIEAMDELGLRPSVIAGTSIGALIGAGWAAGMSGRELREHAIDVLGTIRTITGRLWAKRAGNFGDMVRGAISMQLDANHVVEAFVPDDFPLDFRDLRIPLYIIAADFTSWHQVVFHSGPVKPAIAGSIAIPSLFRPVDFEGHLLVDGGVVNPLPLDAASADTDILIGIDVNGDPTDTQHPKGPSPLEMVMGSAQIMMHQLIANMIAAYPPDVYFRPHLHTFGAHEYWRVRDIIEASAPHKERFKREIANKLEDFIVSQQRTM